MMPFLTPTLMDCFYVWLRRSVWDLSPTYEKFRFAELSPKWSHEINDGELIDDSSRHGGDAARSKAVYEDGMFRAFQSCQAALAPEGLLVIVFANKQPAAWETLASALIRAGFVVDGSWPIQTENVTRSRARAQQLSLLRYGSSAGNAPKPPVPAGIRLSWPRCSPTSQPAAATSGMPVFAGRTSSGRPPGRRSKPTANTPSSRRPMRPAN